jgi:hypothetical protein
MDEFSGAFAQGGLDLVDEPFQPLGGGRPLRLLGRELVRGLPDLLRRPRPPLSQHYTHRELASVTVSSSITSVSDEMLF